MHYNSEIKKNNAKRFAGFIAALILAVPSAFCGCKGPKETDSSGNKGPKQPPAIQQKTTLPKSSSGPVYKTTPFKHENSVSDTVLTRFQKMAPADISAEHLRLCSEAFKAFATSSDGSDISAQIPADSYDNFLKMALCLPKTELKYLANNEIDEMLFSKEIKNAKKVLHEKPADVKAFAQRSFECKRYYETHEAMKGILPQKRFEGDTDYIYWDVAKKDPTKTRPTIGVGINLYAHFILSDIRIQNSQQIQEILHPDNPSARSNSDYIKLTREDLKKLTAHVIQKKETNYVAPYFQTTYQLNVHPDDKPQLKKHYHDLLASAIRACARDIAIERPERGEELLFGTYDNPVPMEAPMVATDIAYRGGGLAASEKFREAYIARDWKRVRKECVPNEMTLKNWFAGRFAWRRKQIANIINRGKCWPERYPWIVGLLALLVAAGAVKVSKSKGKKPSPNQVNTR